MSRRSLDDYALEAWERMTDGGVVVDLSIYTNEILKAIWLEPIAAAINSYTILREVLESK